MLTTSNRLDTPAAQPAFRYWSPWLGAFACAWLAVFLWLAPSPLALLASNWPLIGVGFCGAVLGNISAVGGGIVFIPTMMFGFHQPPVAALKIALGSQSFGMSSGAIGWLRRRAAPKGALLLTVPGLLAGSAVSTLVLRPSPLLIKGLFGPVSIALGALTLVSLRGDREKRAGLTEVPRRARVPLVLASVIGGLLTGWVAIGEGEVIAALLMLAYGMDASVCIGLGVLLLAVNWV